MKFENTPKGDYSYEKPKAGKYLGLLVGFAYCGTQPGEKYGPKPKVMLRWELHKRKGPSLDSDGHIHTITQTFGATVRGDQSLLKKCLEAHGIAMPEGSDTESRDWLGHAAWLDVIWTVDEKYENVTGISRLDPDDDVIPGNKLHFEHWEEAEGEGMCPEWANWAVLRSTDLKHRARERDAKPAANGTPVATVVVTAEQEADIPF